MDHERLIELPIPPRSVPAPENQGGGRAEEVVIATNSGKKVVGRLRQFDSDNGLVVVRDEHSKETTELPMGEIKMLHLVESRQFVFAEDYIQKHGDVVMPPDRQEYELIFKDDSAMDGETFGYVTDNKGLHLFLAQPFNKYTHQFVPFTALKSQRIGPFLGQMLLKENAVTKAQLDQGLQEQDKMRKQRIGEYLTSNEVVTSEQLQAALTRQQSTPNLKLGEALIQEGLLTEQQLKDALSRQKEDRKRPLGQILIAMGLVNRDLIKRTLASKLGIPFVNLRKFNVDPNIIARVPAEIARKHNVVPLCLYDTKMILAVEDPMDRAPLEAIRFHTKTFVEPVLADPEEIMWAIDQYYGSNIDALARELGGEEEETESAAQEVVESDNTLVKLVNKVILDAHRQGASDIHIEPYPGRQKTIIRFRIDGSLIPYVELPYNYRNAIISRIKIMCDLDIAERRKPQDGKIDFKRFGPAKIELRVATVPTSSGLEDVVMRILANGEPIPIDNLGLSRHNLAQLKSLVTRPYGLFLVCGPTGSGKTTTLHSVLGHINTPERKIWTAEDPVEITQRGLRQVQVNPKIDLTFANAMRAFLRADPDVIMVGEMRDKETTSMGIEASLTGHLVFSTLHTNNAPESIVRLLDMGMDPFNFADALLGILAQRLAKTLCPICKQSYVPTAEDLHALAVEYCAEIVNDDQMTSEQKDSVVRKTIERWKRRYSNDAGEIHLNKATGCEECGNTGFRGRMGLHELLVASDEIKRLIHTHATVAEVFHVATRERMRTLKQDGIEKVLQGYTDINQVRAVCVK